MIRTVYAYIAEGTDPFTNQAVEKTLLANVPENTLILYLWRNAHTVVIGRNQDCYDQCRVLELEASGGHLARRITGGGAVYHDAGNLNFTFLVQKPDYDVRRQSEVICSAVAQFHIHSEISGRNDLLADGRKFSGHAYRLSDTGCCHHGTLLIDTNADMLSHYLYVDTEKLAVHGVRSVRARVVNLRELSPEVNADTLTDAIVQSVSQQYGVPVEPLPPLLLPAAQVARETAFFADDSWRYGSHLPHAERAEARFPWGGLKLEWIAAEGVIRDAAAYSDAMEWDEILEIPNRLRGCPATADALRSALSGTPVFRDAALLITSCLFPGVENLREF